MINKYDVKNLAKSFSYALKGISYCIKNERNMRIHLSAIVMVTLFALFFGITIHEWGTLIICFAIVCASEIMNTAIETLTNLESPSYHNLAKISKDVAAGAVFICASASILVGLTIFLKPQKLINTFLLIIGNPFYILIFAVLIVFSILFVFNGAKLFKEPQVKIYSMKNYDDKKHQ